MADNPRYVTYSEKEKEIVKSGIAAIREVLMGENTDEKESLLLALDWFMDPYYKQNIYIADIWDDLIQLLQTVVITPNDEEVAEDAWHLLSSYAWRPFEIIENNLDKVPEQLRPYVLGDLQAMRDM